MAPVFSMAATDPDRGRRGEFPPLTCYIDKRLFVDPTIDPQHLFGYGVGLDHGMQEI